MMLLIKMLKCVVIIATALVFISMMFGWYLFGGLWLPLVLMLQIACVALYLLFDLLERKYNPHHSIFDNNEDHIDENMY